MSVFHIPGVDFEHFQFFGLQILADEVEKFTASIGEDEYVFPADIKGLRAGYGFFFVVFGDLFGDACRAIVNDGVTVLYISHDLSTVKYLCERTAIMYRGRFVEMGLTDRVIDQPQHPYARALKAAIPIADPEIR